MGHSILGQTQAQCPLLTPNLSSSNGLCSPSKDWNPSQSWISFLLDVGDWALGLFLCCWWWINVCDPSNAPRAPGKPHLGKQLSQGSSCTATSAPVPPNPLKDRGQSLQFQNNRQNRADGNNACKFSFPGGCSENNDPCKREFWGGFSSPLSSCFALTCRTSLHYSFSCVDYTIKWQRHVFDICLISMTTDYETRCSEHARRNLRKMMKLNEDLINVKNSNKGGEGKTQQRYFLYGRHVFFYFFYKCIFLSPFCYPNIIE